MLITDHDLCFLMLYNYSPVYTRPLIRIGIQIKLNQIRVNAVNPVQNPDYLIHIRMWFEFGSGAKRARVNSCMWIKLSGLRLAP